VEEDVVDEVEKNVGGELESVRYHINKRYEVFKGMREIV
jgi:hypothetical protein